MPKPMQISIPQPCHEKWESMTPVEKGRFCASCQQRVYDFTNSPDREIATILKSEKGACGRFRSDQLERDLITYNEKTNYWKAASIALLSVIGLINHKAIAQETVKTELHENDAVKAITKKDYSNSIITGIVRDSLGPMPGTSVTNFTKGITVKTNYDGLFEIKATKGDSIAFSFVGFKTHKIIVEEKRDVEIILEESRKLHIIDVYGRPDIKNKTFFGRLFYRIGNWYRRQKILLTH